MRLIDADALLADLGINDLDCTKCDWCGRFDCVRGSDFRDACNAIDDAPTVDAVEVVRCEDCRWRHEEKCPMYHEDWFEIDEGDGFADGDYEVTDNTEDSGFCHCGERRGDDG